MLIGSLPYRETILLLGANPDAQVEFLNAPTYTYTGEQLYEVISRTHQHLPLNLPPQLLELYRPVVEYILSEGKDDEWITQIMPLFSLEQKVQLFTSTNLYQVYRRTHSGNESLGACELSMYLKSMKNPSAGHKALLAEVEAVVRRARNDCQEVHMNQGSVEWCPVCEFNPLDYPTVFKVLQGKTQYSLDYYDQCASVFKQAQEEGVQPISDYVGDLAQAMVHNAALHTQAAMAQAVDTSRYLRQLGWGKLADFFLHHLYRKYWSTTPYLGLTAEELRSVADVLNEAFRGTTLPIHHAYAIQNEQAIDDEWVKASRNWKVSASTAIYLLAEFHECWFPVVNENFKQVADFILSSSAVCFRSAMTGVAPLHCKLTEYQRKVFRNIDKEKFTSDYCIFTCLLLQLRGQDPWSEYMDVLYESFADGALFTRPGRSPLEHRVEFAPFIRNFPREGYKCLLNILGSKNLASDERLLNFVAGNLEGMSQENLSKYHTSFLSPQMFVDNLVTLKETDNLVDITELLSVVSDKEIMLALMSKYADFFYDGFVKAEVSGYASLYLYEAAKQGTLLDVEEPPAFAGLEDFTAWLLVNQLNWSVERVVNWRALYQSTGRFVESLQLVESASS